jgi:3-hydroxyisobutyrate dehydrogenase-like beta-hydroxyacid dehydrogenase
MSATATVGVIGLGTIGLRISRNLAKKGFSTVVWNRTPKKEPNFVDSPAAVAEKAPIIEIFLSDDRAVLQIIEALKGSLRSDHLLVIHSTISPDTVREVQALTSKSGAHVVDAPFTGSRAAAENGQLVFYVAGAPEDLERAKPILEASSKAIVNFDHVGDASTVKIATNLITAAIVEALAEALAITKAANIEPQKLVRAIEVNASRSVTGDMKLGQIIERDFEPHFSLANMLKDSRLALTLAKKAGVSLPLTATLEKQLSSVAEKGFWEKDFAIVSTAVLDQLPC